LRPLPPTCNSVLHDSSSVTIYWSGQNPRGSEITNYTVRIRQSNGIYTTESVHCINTVNTGYCYVPISVLRAPPYNLAWGSTVMVTVSATNIVGTSVESEPGGEAVILTVPNPPTSLANNPAVLTALKIGLTWTAPAENGGSQILNYDVQY